MIGDREFDELLRQKISETLEEPIDESIDADDLMFDLGMRYLRMVAAEKKKSEGKKRDSLSLWAEGAPSKRNWSTMGQLADTVLRWSGRAFCLYSMQHFHEFFLGCSRRYARSIQNAARRDTG